MAISDQITAINNAKQAIRTAIEAKGVPVGTTPLSGYANKINAISTQSWVRPSDWLALPAITSADQKFVGLHAVYPYSNFATLTASGAFTVDWGDGTVANYAAGTIAEHEYNYNNPALNGTLTSLGYKQAVVTLTMQAGQTFTSLDLSQPHSVLMDFVYQVTANWLDIAISGSQLSALQIGPSIYSENVPAAPMLLEQASVLSANISNASFMFSVCMSLQSIPILNIGNGVESTSYMFYACSTLAVAPIFNTSLVTDLSSMFEDCLGLKRIPLYDTSSAESMARMLCRCETLQAVPLFNTASVVDMSQMFYGCTSMIEIPFLDTSSVENIYGFIENSGLFKRLPAIDLTYVRPSPIAFQFPATLTQFSIIGYSGALNLSGCALSAAALNEIFTNLATAIPAKEDDEYSNSIDISYCYGAAECDTSIATAKGWVVFQ